MKTRRIVLTAIFIALVYVATLIIQIPIPGTSGYVNLGDSFILLSGYFFGPITGFIAGGFGSALTDLSTGYGFWAPFTLIIKGIIGLLMGYFKNRKLNVYLLAVFAEIWMVIGYLLGGTILTGSLAVSLGSVPANSIQGIIGVVLFIILKEALEKMGFEKRIKK